MVTPLGVTNLSSFTVPTMFPPAEAARSTHTDPGLSLDTMSAVIRVGAFLPGMSAVVITMSTSSHCFESMRLAAVCHSADISLAYPPAPSPLSLKSTSRNSAPIDCHREVRGERSEVIGERSEERSVERSEVREDLSGHPRQS